MNAIKTSFFLETTEMLKRVFFPKKAYLYLKGSNFTSIDKNQSPLFVDCILQNGKNIKINENDVCFSLKVTPIPCKNTFLQKIEKILKKIFFFLQQKEESFPSKIILPACLLGEEKTRFQFNDRLIELHILEEPVCDLLFKHRTLTEKAKIFIPDQSLQDPTEEILKQIPQKEHSYVPLSVSTFKKESSYQLQFEAPGLKKENIKILIDSGYLFIFTENHSLFQNDHSWTSLFNNQKKFHSYESTFDFEIDVDHLNLLTFNEKT